MSSCLASTVFFLSGRGVEGGDQIRVWMHALDIKIMFECLYVWSDLSISGGLVSLCSFRLGASGLCVAWLLSNRFCHTTFQWGKHALNEINQTRKEFHQINGIESSGLLCNSILSLTCIFS